MDDLRVYLQKATRGLWGKKRQEVWQELEGNLHIRIQELQVQGLSQENATQQALAEIGEPREVSVGMRRIYTLPRLGLVLMLATVLVGFSLLWISQVRAQGGLRLEGVFEASLLSDELESSNGYLNAASLIEELSKAGVAVKDLGLALELQFPGASAFRVGLETKTLKRIVRLSMLAQQAEQAGIKPSLEGWNTGTLKLGSVQLRLWNASDPPIFDPPVSPNLGYIYYGGLIQRTIQDKLQKPFLVTLSSSNPGCRHIVEVGGSPGQIYALISALPLYISQSADSPRFRKNLFDMAAVDGSGKLAFHLPASQLEFTTDLSQVKPMTTSAEPVALLKVTGEFKDGNLVLQPVMPGKSSSQSLSGSCF